MFTTRVLAPFARQAFTKSLALIPSNLSQGSLRSTFATQNAKHCHDGSAATAVLPVVRRVFPEDLIRMNDSSKKGIRLRTRFSKEGKKNKRWDVDPDANGMVKGHESPADGMVKKPESLADSMDKKPESLVDSIVKKPESLADSMVKKPESPANTVQGASFRPLNLDLYRTACLYKARNKDEVIVYTVPAGTPVPENLVLVQDEPRHYALGPKLAMKYNDLNHFLTEFCKKYGDPVTKDQFRQRNPRLEQEYQAELKHNTAASTPSV